MGKSASENKSELKVELIRTEDLKPDPTNARKHSIRNLKAITDSLKKFGQQKPIVIDADNMVRAGNGTLEAAKEMGWPTIACVRTNLSAAELKAYAIADNRTSELAEWDTSVLLEQLNDFEGLDGDLLTAAGFNDGDMAALLSVNDPITDPNQHWQGMPEFQQNNIVHRTMLIHFLDEDAVQEFAKLMAQGVGEKTKYLWFPASAGEHSKTAHLRTSSETPTDEQPDAA